MSAPTPANEKYTSCVGSIFNIGGTYAAGTGGAAATVTGGTSLTVQKGGIKRNQDVQDMTSNTDAGFYTDVPTIKKATGSFTCAYIGTSPPTFTEGQLYSVVICNPITTAVFEGTCRFNNIEEPFLNVTEGMIYTFDLTSQGAYTWTN